MSPAKKSPGTKRLKKVRGLAPKQVREEKSKEIKGGRYTFKTEMTIMKGS